MRWPISTWASQPPIERNQPSVPVVVDVGDDQPDLVDVPDHRDKRPCVGFADPRDRRAEPIGLELGERCGLAPDCGGRRLVSGRRGARQQSAEQVWDVGHRGLLAATRFADAAARPVAWFQACGATRIAMPHGSRTSKPRSSGVVSTPPSPSRERTCSTSSSGNSTVQWRSPTTPSGSGGMPSPSQVC